MLCLLLEECQYKFRIVLNPLCDNLKVRSLLGILMYTSTFKVCPSIFFPYRHTKQKQNINYQNSYRTIQIPLEFFKENLHGFEYLQRIQLALEFLSENPDGFCNSYQRVQLAQEFLQSPNGFGILSVESKWLLKFLSEFSWLRNSYSSKISLCRLENRQKWSENPATF